MSFPNQSFTVHTQDFSNNKFTDSEIPALEEGEAVLQVEKYALTSNNITYAVTGFLIGYWKFFPTEQPMGIIPVWGYAKVIESKHPDLKEGDRYYGYYPMSKLLKVKVGTTSEIGFVDVAEHRVELPKIYNFYTNVANDPSHHPSFEDYTPIVRPLFVTGFLSYNFLKDNNFFEADQAIVTSASSKTALSIAFLLKKNQSADGKKIIGLTSSRNVDFVKSTGYYDEVIAYDKVESELPHENSVLVDMAGNSSLLIRSSKFLGEKMKFISRIGMTDWSSDKSFDEIKNSKFFFAPTFAQAKVKEWGMGAFNKRVGIEMVDFTKNSMEWLELAYLEDNNALADFYPKLLQGNIDPSKGYIVKNG